MRAASISILGFTALAVALSLAPVACSPSGPPLAVARMANEKEKRASLVGRASDPIGPARNKLIELSVSGAVTLDVRDGAQETRLELPSASVLDDVESIVVVRVDAAGHYGTAMVTDTAMLEEMARRDAGTSTIAVMRVADETTLEQIIGIGKALKRAGLAHVIMGLLPAQIPAPASGWESCPAPRAYGIDAYALGAATISIKWDSLGRAGNVRVLDSTGKGFGAAAALCALWQRPSTSRCKIDPPCTQKLHVNFIP